MTGSAIELGMAPSDDEEDERGEHIEILVPLSETLRFDFVLDMAFIQRTATFRLSCSSHSICLTPTSSS